jgi:hypothetical protein
VFEFICLYSFENLQKFPFPPQASADPAKQLANSRAAQRFGSPPAARHSPHRLLSLRLADGWGPVVIPDLRPDPRAGPDRARCAPAPRRFPRAYT